MNIECFFEMKTMRSGVIFVFCVFFVVGCTVKENREECPCRVVMDFSKVDTSLVKGVNVLAMSSGGIVFSDYVDVLDFGKEYVREVPHDEMKINVWGGDGADEDLTIPYGCECPDLYMYTFEPDTRGEIWHESVRLRKNHCCLTVLLEGCDEIPYSLTFKGNVDGYGYDGLPSEGEFSCVAYPVGTGGSQVVVPRQTDRSLMMEVDDSEASVTKMFAIGEYLDSAGYDWDAVDLEDVLVVIDYYLTGFRITFKGWDEENYYDIIL